MALVTITVDIPEGAIWVSPAGGGDGSSEGTPTTLTTANANVTAGSLVVMKGGDYTVAIDPAASGTAGSPIAYVAAPSETPKIISGGQQAIDLTGRQHIIIDGIHIDGGQGNEAGAFSRWVQMSNTHNCEVRNCNMKFANVFGINFVTANTFNWFHHNIFDYVGELGARGTNDVGELFRLFVGQFNLIEYNTFRHGGHNLLQVEDDFNIFRFNDFDNTWSDISGYENGGSQGYSAAEPAGNRSFTVKDCTRCVFEWNTIQKTRWASDSNPPSVALPNALKTEGEDHIFRRNFVFDNISDGISQVLRTETPFSRRVHHYHNSLWGNQDASWILDTGAGGVQTNGNANVWKNNVSFNDGSPQIVIDIGAGVNRDNLIQSNAFCPATGQNFQIGGTTQSVAAWEGAFSGEVDGNITAADPGWVGGDEPRTIADFALASDSPLIDQGGFLTVTVGTGSNSTSMTVADAGYFYDGFGHPKAQGDEIMLAGGGTARITAIDYGTNVLTLDTPLSWSNGEGVAQPFNGAAPDIGAREFEMDPPS